MKSSIFHQTATMKEFSRWNKVSAGITFRTHKKTNNLMLGMRKIAHLVKIYMKLNGVCRIVLLDCPLGNAEKCAAVNKSSQLNIISADYFYIGYVITRVRKKMLKKLGLCLRISFFAQSYVNQVSNFDKICMKRLYFHKNMLLNAFVFINNQVPFN